MAIINIYGARVVSHYFMITKTPNLSNVKLKLVCLDQYSPIKIYKLYGTKIYTLHNMGAKNIALLIHIYGAKAIFFLFCDHQDTEYESREIEIITY